MTPRPTPHQLATMRQLLAETQYASWADVLGAEIDARADVAPLREALLRHGWTGDANATPTEVVEAVVHTLDDRVTARMLELTDERDEARVNADFGAREMKRLTAERDDAEDRASAHERMADELRLGVAVADARAAEQQAMADELIADGRRLIAMADELRAENERLRAECTELRNGSNSWRRTAGEWGDQRDAARARLAAVDSVRCWTNEDGRRFAFADDLYAALHGDGTDAAAEAARLGRLQRAALGTTDTETTPEGDSR